MSRWGGGEGGGREVRARRKRKQEIRAWCSLVASVLLGSGSRDICLCNTTVKTEFNIACEPICIRSIFWCKFEYY